jgi:cellulose biosynthesis protein BcsQ
MAGARFVVLGLAPVRSEWFRTVARWANEAAIPVEFIKCISTTEVRARLDDGRPFSALLVDASSPGIDRDLFDHAVEHGCAPVVIDNGLVERSWSELGVSAVLPERFESADLISTLERVSQQIDRAGTLTPPSLTQTEGPSGSRTIVVTGAGGMGTSTVAMALAQGLGRLPERRRLLLADMALRSSQAMMHDARDVVPGLTELVEGHRLGTPADDTIAEGIFSLPDRGYHLLLGLRHECDWQSVSARSLDAAWASMDRLYTTTVADITGDFEGSEGTGANDLDDRNRLARTAARRADLVVVVGSPGSWGVHRLVQTILNLIDLGVPTERILPCVNHAPRKPRARSGITAAVGDLVSSRAQDAGPLATPVFVPTRKHLDEVLRDGDALPSQLSDPVSSACNALLNRPANHARPAPSPEPVAVAPGSLGTWATDE